MEGHNEVVEYLVNHGANVNIRDNDGKSAIHYAAENGTQISKRYNFSFCQMNHGLITEKKLSIPRDLCSHRSIRILLIVFIFFLLR